jgi:hypothetical protein
MSCQKDYLADLRMPIAGGNTIFFSHQNFIAAQVAKIVKQLSNLHLARAGQWVPPLQVAVFRYSLLSE